LDAFLTTIIETFRGHDQQPSDPIERISFPPPVPECLVLDPSAYQVHTAVRQPDHMERVGHLKWAWGSTRS